MTQAPERRVIPIRPIGATGAPDDASAIVSMVQKAGTFSTFCMFRGTFEKPRR